MKYPPQFLSFVSSLSIFQLNFFAVFKIDCLATTDLYTKFICTMVAPVVIVALVQLYKVCKHAHIRAQEQAKIQRATNSRVVQSKFVNATQAQNWLEHGIQTIRADATADMRGIDASCAGYSFAGVFFLYPMLSRTGTPCA